MMERFSGLSPKLFAPLLTGLIVTGIVTGCKVQGWLESAELNAYDQATRWRTPEKPDERLLIVGITEQDIAKYKYPIPDDILNQAVTKLLDHHAFLVGIDLVKDLAQGNLLKTLQTQDQVIPICSHGRKGGDILKSPPDVPVEKIGFVDIPVDPDGVVRRASLVISGADPLSGCQAEKSLALQLAESYLANLHQIEPSFDEKTGSYLLGKLAIPQLQANDGGYSKADVYGYPLLIQYRHPQKVAPIVSLTDVLENKVPDAQIKDRVVLLGSTAGSLKDEVRTPYSAGKAEDSVMQGVVVHAQITSQLISAVLDHRPLSRFLPEWLEGIILLGWSMGGGYIAWFVHHPGKLAGAVGGASLAVVGTFGLLFINAWWLPVVSPLLGLLGSALGAGAWRTYQTNQDQEKMLMLSRNQERTIDALKQLLTQQPATMPATMIPTGTVSATPISQQATTVPFSVNAEKLLGDRYQTIGILGAGGFATTYLAEDTKRPSHPRCAIKHLMPARRDAAFVEMSRRLFTTEAKILDQLGTHPQIPHLLAYFEQEQEFYLVQELIVGTALNDELAERLEPWTQRQVVEFLQQMLPVLDYIHSQHVIHRDIKPSNIIRASADGRLVLIDFGAVKEINPQLPAEANSTIAIGTRGYTPAEQYAGRPTFSSDIYALGMIAIEAATNCSPRDLELDEHTGNLQWRHLAPLTVDLMQLIDRMVAYQYINRYQSAAAVLTDLQAVIYPPDAALHRENS